MKGAACLLNRPFRSRTPRAATHRARNPCSSAFRTLSLLACICSSSSPSLRSGHSPEPAPRALSPGALHGPVAWWESNGLRGQPSNSLACRSIYRSTSTRRNTCRHRHPQAPGTAARAQTCRARASRCATAGELKMELYIKKRNPRTGSWVRVVTGQCS